MEMLTPKFHPNNGQELSFCILSNKKPLQFEVSIPISSTVEDLKQKVIHMYDVPVSCFRLIFQGKMMGNKDKLSSFGFKPGKNYLHCSIIPKKPELLVASETQDNTPLPMGFDRLREMGFDVNEIREIREQFHLTRLRTHAPSQQELFQLEEEFLRAGLSQADMTAAQEQRERQEREEGTHFDLVGGMTMGFFLGLIMLFWMWENQIMTGRTKCGILVGIGCNLSFCLLQVLF